MPRKICFKCQCSKPLGDFYRHPRMSDGHLNKCKECTRSDVRINYRYRRRKKSAYEKKRRQGPERKLYQAERQRLHCQRHPVKSMARSAVSNALRDGRIERGPCEVCGGEAEAHHDDYNKFLDVRWLCFRHHRELHGQVVI